MGEFFRKSSRAFIGLSLIIFIIILSIFNSTTIEECALAETERSSYCVMEVNTRTVLDSHNGNIRLPMASTTKAMTALIACESGKMNDVVTITSESVGVEGSSIYLKEDDKLTLRDLTYGLMLRSGNDAATAIAIYLAGTVEKFVDKMNARAKAMGLNNTRFVNPQGLHDDNHYTTAEELAVIACEGLKNEELKKIVSTTSYKTSEEVPRLFINKNKLLKSYDGATGFKTGYTKKAGRCLIASSSRDGLDVVAVVLNEPDMWNKCASLMDEAHETYEYEVFAKHNEPIGEIPVKFYEESSVEIGCAKDVGVVYNKDSKVSVVKKIDSHIEKYEKGIKAGVLKIFIDNKLQFSVDLVTI